MEEKGSPIKVGSRPRPNPRPFLRPQSMPSKLATRRSSRIRFSTFLAASHIDDAGTYLGGDHDQNTEEQMEEVEEMEEGDEESDTESVMTIDTDLDDPEDPMKTKEEEEEYKGKDGREANAKDLESGATLEVKPKSRKSIIRRKSMRKTVVDPYLVSWEGPNDPANPKNWPTRQKWAATFIVSAFTFISPVSSSMVAPALTTIAAEFGIKTEVESQLILSIFLLAYAIGPLIVAPLSEMYGRVPVLQIANLFYLVFNLACGVAQNKGQMIAFRFLAGLGGSAPLALGGGVLSDSWRADERGRAIAIYTLAPLLGPAIGPLAGGFITQYTTWRWAFYATSLADGVVQALGLFFLRETHPPTLLHRKAAKLRKETGNDMLHTSFEQADRSFTTTMRRSLIRPFRLLGTQPIVQILACYMAYLYGIIYLVLSTFPTLWEKLYHEPIGTGGLNYISLGVGFFLGTQICGPLNDVIYRRLKARHGTGRPEFRIPLMIPGSFLVPIGLFLYGWSAQSHTHWIVPNIGAAIFAFGAIAGFQCIQTYLIDAYVQYAASAIGAATVLRSAAGFGFPLFAPIMYNVLGYGWGNSVLAFVAIAVGFPAPILLYIYGERLRKRSTFAAGGE